MGFFFQSESLEYQQGYNVVSIITSVCHTLRLSSSPLSIATGSGICNTDDISIEFEIECSFVMILFITCSANHNEILHMSRQLHCRDMCLILLWLVEHILNQNTPNFVLSSNFIKIPLVGQVPHLNYHYTYRCPGTYQCQTISRFNADFKVRYNLFLLNKILLFKMALWHHAMEILSAWLALCQGNLPVTDGFPSQRVSDAELWCLPKPIQAVRQTVQSQVIWDTMMLMWGDCSDTCIVVLWWLNLSIACVIKSPYLNAWFA